MRLKGDCSSCSKMESCSETSVQRILEGYTCPLYVSAPQAIYEARVTAYFMFGPFAFEAIIGDRPEDPRKGAVNGGGS